MRWWVDVKFTPFSQELEGIGTSRRHFRKGRICILLCAKFQPKIWRGSWWKYRRLFLRRSFASPLRRLVLACGSVVDTWPVCWPNLAQRLQICLPVICMSPLGFDGRHDGLLKVHGISHWWRRPRSTINLVSKDSAHCPLSIESGPKTELPIGAEIQRRVLSFFPSSDTNVVCETFLHVIKFRENVC